MHYNLIMHHYMVRFFCAEEVMLSLYDNDNLSIKE